MQGFKFNLLLQNNHNYLFCLFLTILIYNLIFMVSFSQAKSLSDSDIQLNNLRLNSKSDATNNLNSLQERRVESRVNI